ncbi:hypothetical protein ABN226_18620, partial [Morganella morganii]|uniref:hypothetical protein n=1 Tax=Morganella morganii TaxID=582 RepID=UPI0032DBB08A
MDKGKGKKACFEEKPIRKRFSFRLLLKEGTSKLNKLRGEKGEPLQGDTSEHPLELSDSESEDIVPEPPTMSVPGFYSGG